MTIEYQTGNANRSAGNKMTEVSLQGSAHLYMLSHPHRNRAAEAARIEADCMHASGRKKEKYYKLFCSVIKDTLFLVSLKLSLHIFTSSGLHHERENLLASYSTV